MIAVVPPEPRRAPALSPDERRDMILDAAIPLFSEHGRDVTTKEIADAAGIAEGTVFRVFKDKQELCEAAVARYLDLDPICTTLADIDPSSPLEEKVRRAVRHLRERFHGIMGMMSALGVHGNPHDRSPHADTHHRGRLIGHLARLLKPDAEMLRIDPMSAARLIRLVVFASEIPPFSGPHRVADDELVDFILSGIARRDG